jgi:hypothetical protein
MVTGTAANSASAVMLPVPPRIVFLINHTYYTTSDSPQETKPVFVLMIRTRKFTQANREALETRREAELEYWSTPSIDQTGVMGVVE